MQLPIQSLPIYRGVNVHHQTSQFGVIPAALCFSAPNCPVNGAVIGSVINCEACLQIHGRSIAINGICTNC